MTILIFTSQPPLLANASKNLCELSTTRSPSIPPAPFPKLDEMSHRIEAPYATLESSNFRRDIPLNYFTLSVMPVLRELPKHTRPLPRLSRLCENPLHFHLLP